ncbi:MAG: type III secretion system inner membrane ring subunit SctD [Chlamydiota bacterium]
MTRKLVLEEGLPEGVELELENAEQWIIGRDPSQADLVIEDPKVSRKHLMCRQISQGITIENLSSTNPVYINQHELREPTTLNDDDELKIGGGYYRYRSSEEAPQITGLEEGEGGLPPPSEDEEYDTIFEETEEWDQHPAPEINFDFLESGRWILKIVNGPNAGAEFAMKSGGTYTMGTDAAACDIILHDISVSHQHARLEVSEDDELSVVDLGSRNGTFIGHKRLEEGQKQDIDLQTVVTVGTTSFVVVDREEGPHTIVSPELPVREKAVDAEEEDLKAKLEPDIEEAASKAVEEVLAGVAAEERQPSLKEWLLSKTGVTVMSIVAAVVLLVGVGTFTLFKSEAVVVEQVDFYKYIRDALEDFPEVQFTYNRENGKLFLLGHVLTKVDLEQLMYNIKALPFVSQVQDNVIIDELVWQEINHTLKWNPAFKGVSMHSPRAGLFVLSGYLETKDQADELSEYLALNFSYLDKLKNQVVVEETVNAKINTMLVDKDFITINADFNDGELALAGAISSDRHYEWQDLIKELGKIHGVRQVKNYVVEAKNEDSDIINISDQYTVTGYSRYDKMNVSIVIKGRILTRGDRLDGMTITSIKPKSIILEKDGFKYRINYQD